MRRRDTVGYFGGDLQAARRRMAAIPRFAVGMPCFAVSLPDAGGYNFGLRVGHDRGPIRRSRWPNPSVGTPRSEKPLEDRLDSWKEIAAYLNRDVTTVQRWEKREAMPVHRHLHDRMGSVYASRAELDAWVRGRNLRAARRTRTKPLQPLAPEPPLPVEPPPQPIYLFYPAKAPRFAGRGGSYAGDWRRPLVAKDGILLAQPDR